MAGPARAATRRPARAEGSSKRKRPRICDRTSCEDGTRCVTGCSSTLEEHKIVPHRAACSGRDAGRRHSLASSPSAELCRCSTSPPFRRGRDFTVPSGLARFGTRFRIETSAAERPDGSMRDACSVGNRPPTTRDRGSTHFAKTVHDVPTHHPASWDDGRQHTQCDAEAERHWRGVGSRRCPRA